MSKQSIRNRMSPGEILEGLLHELHLSQRAFARHLRISQPYLSDIMRGKRGISPEMAHRLARALGSTPQTWMNLQTNWLLSKVDEKKLAGITKLAA